MNKKVLALLSSVLSTALIVGGSFAAATNWAVTDEAGTQNAQLTGGTISGETNTYVTLSWGEGTVMNDVENMADGTNYLVGSLKLKTDGATYNEGSLAVELISSATGAQKLKDYISIKIYEGVQTLKGDGSLPDATPIENGVINRQIDVANAEDRNYSIAPVVTGNADGQVYTVFATLNCGGSTQIYSQVKNDVVFVRVDWQPLPAHVSSAHRVYVAKPSTWGTTFNIYSYKDNPQAENSTWPGLPMSAETETRGGVSYYYADVNTTTFDTFIFNDGSKQTVNIPLSGWSADKPVVAISTSTDSEGKYTYSWTTLSALDSAKTYKLVGNMKGAEDADANWEYTAANAVTLTPSATVEGEYVGVATGLKVGDEVKVRDDTNWYPASGGNYYVTENGDYDIYFRPAGNTAWGDIYYFTLVKKTA